MEYLWFALIGTTLVIYPVIVLRSALRGRQWAIDTLEAMRYVGGDLMTTSAWLSLPPERRRDHGEPMTDPEERFVA